MSFDLKIQNNDLAISNGAIKIVENSEKLIQDIIKVCLTEAGSNPMHPGYGSHVSKSIIGSVMESTILIQVAQSHLNSAIENLKTLQEIQSRSHQQVSAEEQISAILQVSVKKNALLPTLFDVRISVASKAFNQISTEFNINFL